MAARGTKLYQSIYAFVTSTEMHNSFNRSLFLSGLVVYERDFSGLAEYLSKQEPENKDYVKKLTDLGRHWFYEYKSTTDDTKTHQAKEVGYAMLEAAYSIDPTYARQREHEHIKELHIHKLAISFGPIAGDEDLTDHNTSPTKTL